MWPPAETPTTEMAGEAGAGLGKEEAAACSRRSRLSCSWAWARISCCRSKTRDEDDDMTGVLEPPAEDDAECVAGVAGVACSGIGRLWNGKYGATSKLKVPVPSLRTLSMMDRHRTQVCSLPSEATTWRRRQNQTWLCPSEVRV